MLKCLSSDCRNCYRVSGWRCRRRRSGNMPVVRGHKLLSVLVKRFRRIRQILMAITPIKVRQKGNTVKNHLRCRNCHPIVGDFIKCTAMFWSGAVTGMVRMTPSPRPTLRDQKVARTVCYAAAVGSASLAACGQLAGTGAPRVIGTRTWASAS